MESSRKKGFSAGEVDKTITWLKEQNLINDEEFAHKYVTSIISVKSVGPRYLLHKLKQKKVDETIATHAVDQAYQEVPEEDLINQAVTSWKKVHPKHADDKQRLVRHLASRGFTSHKIYKTIN